MELPSNPTKQQLNVIQTYLKVHSQSNPNEEHEAKKYYKDKHEIIGSKLVIFKHSQKKKEVWYMRLYIGNKKYKTLSLRTSDKDLAIERSLEKWRSLQNHLDTGGSVFEESIQETFRQYQAYLMRLVQTQQIKKLTYTCKITSIKKLQLFLECYEKPSNIPSNVMNNYVFWRRTKNWDRSKHKNNPNPPTDQTINRELSDFKGFFKWLKTTNKIMIDIPMPFLRIDWKKYDNKNPSFDQEDWLIILSFMEKWSKHTQNRKEFGIFYRKLFCEFLKVLANSGLRPHEALLLRWSDVVIKSKKEVLFTPVKNIATDYEYTKDIWQDARNTYSEITESYEYIFDDLSPETNPNLLPTRYKATRQKLICHIQVSPNTKTGRRLVICPAGFFFKRIKDLYKSKTGKYPQSNDYIFKNIGTTHSRQDSFIGRPITSDHFRKLWYEMMHDLAIQENITFQKHYTIYSCRSYFINQRLEMGIPPQFVAKLVGHSIKTMERHYEDIQLKKLEQELVQNRIESSSTNEYMIYDLENQ